MIKTFPLNKKPLKIKRALISVYDKTGIVELAKSLVSFNIEIISTGGTGLTGRDVTVEAHRDVYEKEIDAFSIVFSIISMKKIGTSAIQSRSTAGVAGGTYLFALPGSPGACKDAWDEILVKQLDFRHQPCNFVEVISLLSYDCVFIFCLFPSHNLFYIIDINLSIR